MVIDLSMLAYTKQVWRERERERERERDLRHLEKLLEEESRTQVLHCYRRTGYSMGSNDKQVIYQPIRKVAQLLCRRQAWHLPMARFHLYSVEVPIRDFHRHVTTLHQVGVRCMSNRRRE